MAFEKVAKGEDPGMDSVVLDTMKEYVAGCQAASKLAQNADTLREPQLGEYVGIVEALNLVMPSKVCREITVANARELQKAWLVKQKETALLDKWVDSVTTWLLDSDLEFQWSVAQPDLKSLPPTLDDERDIESAVSAVYNTTLNDVTNALVKADSSRQALHPLLLICYSWLDQYAVFTREGKRFKKMAPAKLLLAIENVASAYRGMVGCISTVPLDRNATAEDVEFVIPQAMIDTVLSKRRGGGNKDSMSDLNQAGKTMQGFMARSESWRKYRDEFRATQAVDKNIGQEMQEAVSALQKLMNGPVRLPHRPKERDDVIVHALQLLPGLLEGPSKLREGGADPLIVKLREVLGDEVRELEAGHDTGMTMPDLIELLKLVPGTEHTMIKAVSFAVEDQSKSATQDLFTHLAMQTFTSDSAATFLGALRAVAGSDLDIATADKIIIARDRLCGGMAEALQPGATRGALNNFMDAMSEMVKLPMVLQRLGEADKPNSRAIEAVTQASLDVITIVDTLSDPITKEDVSLDSMLKAADKFRAARSKYFDKEPEGLRSIISQIMKDILQSNFDSVNELFDHIKKVGLQELAGSAKIMQRRITEVEPVAGGAEGQTWHDGMSGDLATMIAHAQKTLHTYTHGETIDKSVPIIAQVQCQSLSILARSRLLCFSRSPCLESTET
jgi:hypothetical protein